MVNVTALVLTVLSILLNIWLLTAATVSVPISSVASRAELNVSVATVSPAVCVTSVIVLLLSVSVIVKSPITSAPAWPVPVQTP